MRKTIGLAISSLTITVLLIGAGLFFALPGKTAGQTDKVWYVWVKTSPCSGRTDWITVAKENPGHGGTGYYELASLIESPAACTVNPCTLATAQATAATLRKSTKFADYCCRDYSVWQNTDSGKFTVVKGKQGTAGYGFRFVKGDLCCDEAAAEAGVPNLCGEEDSTSQAHYVGCYRYTPNFDLNGSLERSSTNTPERCIASCKQQGFKYAAVQYGESCLCGNTYGLYGTADNCDYKCTGDPNKKCGGYNANSVYATGIDKPWGRDKERGMAGRP